MKNIHIVPTDQPSRLHYYHSFTPKYALSYKPLNWKTASHIYITSSEEIKEDDWGLSRLNEVILFGRSYPKAFYKKIILTTDPTLIADGIQAIDDEFLGWFVKNPTCEFVETEQWAVPNGYETDANGRAMSVCKWVWRITIPKEEIKPLSNLEERFKRDMNMVVMPLDNENIPEEELVEIAQSSAFETDLNYREYAEYGFEKGFVEGAKWVNKRRYSEDEIRELIIKALTHNDHNLCGSLVTAQGEIRTANFGVWFEENKKK